MRRWRSPELCRSEQRNDFGKAKAGNKKASPKRVPFRHMNFPEIKIPTVRFPSQDAFSSIYIDENPFANLAAQFSVQIKT